MHLDVNFEAVEARAGYTASAINNPAIIGRLLGGCSGSLAPNQMEAAHNLGVYVFSCQATSHRFSEVPDAASHNGPIGPIDVFKLPGVASAAVNGSLAHPLTPGTSVTPRHLMRMHVSVKSA